MPRLNKMDRLAKFLIERMYGKRRIERHIGPIDGLEHLNKIEIAYAMRDWILNKLSENKESVLGILSTITKLDEELLAQSKFEKSENTPALNIFVPVEDYANLKVNGFSRLIKLGLYVNVIFVPKENAKNVIEHEEEHTTTQLARYNSEINNPITVKEGILTELVSIFSNAFAKEKQLTTNERIAEIYNRFKKYYIDHYLEYYLKSKPKLTQKQKSKIRFALLDEFSQKLHAISESLDYLTPQEVMYVLRQTTWSKLENALNTRIKLKQYYLEKRNRKTRYQK